MWIGSEGAEITPSANGCISAAAGGGGILNVGVLRGEQGLLIATIKSRAADF